MQPALKSAKGRGRLQQPHQDASQPTGHPQRFRGFLAIEG